jgi:hypothetical protein
VEVEQVDFRTGCLSVCGATPYSITVGAGGARTSPVWYSGNQGAVFNFFNNYFSRRWRWSRYQCTTPTSGGTGGSGGGGASAYPGTLEEWKHPPVSPPQGNTGGVGLATASMEQEVVEVQQ